MLDKKLLEELCQASGVSGNEGAVREIILREIRGCVKDFWVDALGNLIVFKEGAERARERLLLSAHMDEVGLIITDVTDEGFLKFQTVGGIDNAALCGRNVAVGDKKIPGVIGVKPVHLLDADERNRIPAVDEMFIDIGAENAADARKSVVLGDTACFRSIFDASGDCIRAKAIDDRAGCLVLINMIKGEIPFDMYFSFVVQEEVGLRGAKVTAYAVEPSAAIVVEATTAADIPGNGGKSVCELGGGAVVSFMDKNTIYDKAYYELALTLGKEMGVPVQSKRAVAGGNDAGAIHQSRGGVRTIAVSLPCRYIHSQTSMIFKKDFDAVEKIVFALAERIAREGIA